MTVTRWLLMALVLVIAWPMYSQAYETMQMIRPVAIGAAGTGLQSSNRIYRAYTGLQYEIQATARGGKWPYTYSLSGAPSGMTIVAGPCTDIGTACTAGTITWPSPTAGTTSAITVTITDSLGTQVTGTWSITASTTIGADGFCFLDAVNGNDTTGNGALATPYKTLFKAYGFCGARSIIYFRAGTYVANPSAGFTPSYSTICDGPVYGGTIDWSEAAKGVIWLAYPGDTQPKIDFQTVEGDSNNTLTEFQIRLVGANVWIDGLEFHHGASVMLQAWIRTLDSTNAYGVVIRKNYFHHLVKVKTEQNSAFILWGRHHVSPGPSYFDTVQNNTFYYVRGNGVPFTFAPDAPNGCPSGGTRDDNGSMLKFYDVDFAIIENNDLQDMPYAEAALALKVSTVKQTTRANKIYNNIHTGIGGNMNAYATAPTKRVSGEMLHNFLAGSQTDYEGPLTIGVSSIEPIDDLAIYRNTIMGKISIDWLRSTYGISTFDNNVIVNAGGSGGSCAARATCLSNVADFTRLVINANNVQGVNDGTIANVTTGALVGSYRTTYLGIAGYELTAGAGTSSTSLSGNLNFSGTVRIQ